MEPVKIDPKPPAVLPTQPPEQHLRPAPPMPETPAPAPESKPWWASKTILGILVTLFWLVADPIAAFFGADIAFLKDGFQVPEDFVPLVALVVAAWGRITASKKIG